MPGRTRPGEQEMPDRRIADTLFRSQTRYADTQTSYPQKVQGAVPIRSHGNGLGARSCESSAIDEVSAVRQEVSDMRGKHGEPARKDTSRTPGRPQIFLRDQSDSPGQDPR